MGGYNWEEIKTQIEIGKYTLKEIAEKYKPKGTDFDSAYSYIRRMKKEKGWEQKEKLNKKYTEKVKSKLTEKEVDKEAEIRKEYEKIITNIRRGTYNTLMNERNTDRLRQFKLAMQTIKECRSEQWEVNEILETADKKLIVNQEDKLEMFVNGVENADVIDGG